MRLRATSSATRKFFGFALLATLLLPCRLAAQDPTAYTTGFPPNGVFDGSDFDTVAVASGGLHIHVSLYQVKGRGPSQFLNLHYDNYAYTESARCIDGTCYVTYKVAGGGWELETPTSYGVSYSTATMSYCSNGGYLYAATGVTMTEPDGTSHHFIPDQATLSPPPCFTTIPNGVLYADDGSGWMLKVDPNSGTPVNGPLGFMLVAKDGTQVNATYNSTNMSTTTVLTDPNGNQISETFPSNGGSTVPHTITDTLNRTFSLPLALTFNSQTSWEIDYTDSNGTAQKIQGANTPVSNTYPLTGCGYNPPYCVSAHGQSDPPSQITLPNGLQYNFNYFDSTNPSGLYGEIFSATLPTGGTISWNWQLVGGAHTQVTSRTVTANGNNFVWNYNFSSPPYTTTTDAAQNDTVYYFGTPSSCTGTRAYSDYKGAAGPGTVQYYSGTGTSRTLVKTVANCYTTTNTNLPISETTTWALTNQTSQVQTDWDSFNTGQRIVSWRNPIYKREYAFGNGSPGGLVRTTYNDYLHLTSSTYLNLNIADKPIRTVLFEADGKTIHSQTSYAYDNTTMTGTSGAVGHNYTNFGTSNTLRGNLTQIQRWRSTDNAQLYTYRYFNDLGDLVQTRDPAGNNTYFAYTDSWYQNSCAPGSGTAQAFVTKTTNALGQISTAMYDSCSSRVGSSTDANAQTTTYSYDSMGRRLQTTLADGEQISASYGASLPIMNATTTKITSLLNKMSTVVLDDLGQVRQTQLNSDPDGVTCVDTTYDAFGRKATVTNPYRSGPCSGSSVFTAYTYDALGRLTKVTQTDGSTINTSYADVCSTVTDEAGKIRKSCSDALGRLIQVFEPDSSNNLDNETDYQYDVANNLTSVQQKGNDTNSTHWRPRTFVYNSLSQLTSSTNPEISPTGGSPCSITFTYDLDSNLAGKTAPLPNQVNCSTTVTTNYAYDALNRVLSKSFTNSDPTITYAYDGNSPSGCSTGISSYGLAIGHRTAMCDAAGNEAWIYADITGQGPKITDQRTTNGITETAIYQENLDRSTNTITYPSSRLLSYAPGGAGRPLSATDSSVNYATAAHYAPQGALSSLLNGANFSSTYLYNMRLQMCWIYVTTGTALPSNTLCTATETSPGNILDFQYNFNLGAGDNGNVMGITNNRDTTRSQSFSYDQLNRVGTAETNSTASTNAAHCWGESYVYDNQTNSNGAWGNLTNINVASTAYNGCTQEGLSMVATPQNQISGDTYDANGNLTVSGATTYSYNALGQLTATAGNTYVYDGDGKRVEKATTGPPLQPYKLYWYGMGSDALDETDATGSTTNSSFAEYVMFGGKRVARRDSAGNVLYYFSDHLGTSRVNVLAGQTTPCYDADFYPFGGERAYTNTCSQNYKFTGKERDLESGNDYFGARYYPSAMGRWISPDKPFADQHARNPQSWNLYGYTLNNPLRFIDSDGREVIETRNTTYYEVSGATASEAMANANSHSFGSNADHAGMTTADQKWSTKTSWTSKASDGNVTVTTTVTSDTITLNQVVQLPKWDGYSKASPEDQKTWDNAVTNLQNHETEHEDINRAGADALDKSLPGTTSTAAGKDLDATVKASQNNNNDAVQAKVDANNQATQQQHEQLDKCTNHGTQSCK